MSIRPFRDIKRKKTRVINIGKVLIEKKFVKKAISALHKEFKLN